jgi:hypothetical protein
MNIIITNKKILSIIDEIKSAHGKHIIQANILNLCISFSGKILHQSLTINHTFIYSSKTNDHSRPLLVEYFGISYVHRVTNAIKFKANFLLNKDGLITINIEKIWKYSLNILFCKIESNGKKFSGNDKCVCSSLLSNPIILQNILEIQKYSLTYDNRNYT